MIINIDKVNTFNYPSWLNKDCLYKESTGNLLNNLDELLCDGFNKEIVLIYYIENILHEVPILINDKLKCDRNSIYADYIMSCLSHWKTSIINYYGNYYYYHKNNYKRLEQWNTLDFTSKLMDKLGLDKSTRKLKDVKELNERLSAVQHMSNNYSACINLNNGTLHLINGKVVLKPHNKEDMLFYVLDYDYNKDAACPNFLKFINTSLPDIPSQQIIQEFLGYCLIRNNIKAHRFEKALFLVGDGSNGKSVLYNIVHELFGKQNVCSYQLGDLTNNPNTRFAVKDALINYCSDLQRNSRLDHGILKTLISNEEVSMKPLYMNVINQEFKPKLIFNTNSMPTHIEFSDAFFRRLIIVKFTRKFTKENRDPYIADKIINNELSGVLNWVIQGLERLLKNNQFTISDKVNEALDEYINNQDTVGLWEKEFEISNRGILKVAGQLMYEKYFTFCSKAGLKAINRTTFYNSLEKKKYKNTENAYRKEFYVYIKDERYFNV